MASGAKPEKSLGPQALTTPDRLDWFIALVAGGLAGMVLLALWRGMGGWWQVPLAVWLHLGWVLLALGLTPVILLRRRGDRMHRWLGRLWVGLLAGSALASLFIRMINHGQFSAIHLLSVGTLANLPWLVISARRRDWARHRLMARTMALFALALAGSFTLVRGRLLGDWLWGN